jgi:hypothetical protein
MKECKSCGSMYENHEGDETNLCRNCIESKQQPPKRSILEFWKNRADRGSEDDES